jgi:hypothetical protein
VIDPKRTKLQTLPPGSQQQAPIRQAPRVPMADARRPVKLSPVAYDAANAPPQPTTAQGLLEQLAAQAGFQLVPTSAPGRGRPADVAASSPADVRPTSSTSSPAAEQYPDPKALQADEYVEHLAAFVEGVKANLPPEQQAELEQLTDALAKFAHSVPG